MWLFLDFFLSEGTKVNFKLNRQIPLDSLVADDDREEKEDD